MTSCSHCLPLPTKIRTSHLRSLKLYPGIFPVKTRYLHWESLALTQKVQLDANSKVTVLSHGQELPQDARKLLLCPAPSSTNGKGEGNSCTALPAPKWEWQLPRALAGKPLSKPPDKLLILETERVLPGCRPKLERTLLPEETLDCKDSSRRRNACLAPVLLPSFSPTAGSPWPCSGQAGTA